MGAGDGVWDNTDGDGDVEGMEWDGDDSAVWRGGGWEDGDGGDVEGGVVGGGGVGGLVGIMMGGVYGMEDTRHAVCGMILR